MDTRDLQELVRASHGQHFVKTELADRIVDLQDEVYEIANHRDEANLAEEIGDAGYSLIQLATERGLSFENCVQATISKLDVRPKRKVALIGTSANPITNAHMTMALEILALTDNDEVWFYLVGKHPWGKKLMPAHHRLAMVRLATSAYAKIRYSDFEMVHGEKIYSQYRETAEILRDFFVPSHPSCQFSWVMGSDVAQTFHKWNGADWMEKNLRMTVIHRLGYDFDKANSILSDDRHVYLKDNVVTSNISSSMVRERGKDYDHAKLISLVSENVWQYLVTHKLLDPEALKGA